MIRCRPSAHPHQHQPSHQQFPAGPREIGNLIRSNKFHSISLHIPVAILYLSSTDCHTQVPPQKLSYRTIYPITMRLPLVTLATTAIMTTVAAAAASLDSEFAIVPKVDELRCIEFEVSRCGSERFVSLPTNLSGVPRL
jgi:hypothetical protein